MNLRGLQLKRQHSPRTTLFFFRFDPACAELAIRPFWTADGRGCRFAEEGTSLVLSSNQSPSVSVRCVAVAKKKKRGRTNRVHTGCFDRESMDLCSENRLLSWKRAARKALDSCVSMDTFETFFAIELCFEKHAHRQTDTC